MKAIPLHGIQRRVLMMTWRENPLLKQGATDFWETDQGFSNPITLEEVINRVEEYTW